MHRGTPIHPHIHLAGFYRFEDFTGDCGHMDMPHLIL